MPRDKILLNTIAWQIATGKNGERLYTVTPRTSTPGDAGDMQYADWRVDGPDFNSFELIGPGQPAGYLGRDWGDGTDGRWLGVDTLGPLLNALTLSTYDLTWSPSIPETATFIPSVNLIPGAPGVADNANGSAVILGPTGTPYLYVIRGTGPAKVRLTDMTVQNSGEQLAEAATTIVATRSANATREVSVGMATTAYRVLTAIAAPPNNDTWATNSGSQVARILGIAPDRIAALNNVDQQVLGNVMTGSTTMAAPNWATISTLQAYEPLRMNGFGLDGALWLIGTSNGPYQLDLDTLEFIPTIDEIDNNNSNCQNIASWFPIGTIIPLADGVRYQKSGAGESFGPEVFESNTSPVQGQPQAFAGSSRWLYSTEYNAVTTDTYLIAWRPREAGDPHPHLLSPFVIGKITALQAQFLNFVGTVNGLRTNPTLTGGRGSDMFWATCGRQAREIDDTNYRYAASGKTRFTELRRQPGMIKDIEACEFEAGGTMDASKTIIITVSLDGGSEQAFATQTSTGFKRVLAVSGGAPASAFHGGRRLKPFAAYTTNSSSAAPQIVGNLRLYYRIRPVMVRDFVVPFYIDDDKSRTAEEREDALIAMVGAAPVPMQNWDRDVVYVRVTGVSKMREIVESGGGTDSSRGTRRVCDVSMTEWQIA